MFILINVEHKKMIRLGSGSVQTSSQGGGQKLTSYGNTKGGTYDNFSFTQNKRLTDQDELEISNLVHP